jgi:hypothetical protein
MIHSMTKSLCDINNKEREQIDGKVGENIFL